MSAAGNTKGMWGGRFEGATDAGFYEFERSWRFDRRLLPYELDVDRGWARALEGAGILAREEREKVITALDAIAQHAASEPSWLESSAAEDVHDFVERALVEALGPLGAKLHTGRSRNEMIATEFRLFVRDAAREQKRALAALVAALLALAERHLGVPMPGMTHLQHAQPILLSHWLAAHAKAFAEDGQRLKAAQAEAAADCPMGSGALAGCAFPVDCEALASELGFAAPAMNSLHAVGDRDFALQFLFALSLEALHLSRLSEDVILFASSEFGFVELPDGFSTGSSLMPQKKNPDLWELLRGRSGRGVGALVSLLVTLKGLPSGYQRDLQEDKEPVFAAHDQTLAALRVAAAALRETRFNEARLRRAASDPALLATEAADYLVGRGVPFRQAHEIVGQAIRDAEKQGKPISELPLDTLKKLSPHFGPDFAGALTIEAAIERKRSPGGTSMEAVRRTLAMLKTQLLAMEEPR